MVALLVLLLWVLINVLKNSALTPSLLRLRAGL